MKSRRKLSAVSLAHHLTASCCNIIGESAPTERQVSPGKLYRAALLRSRFADTILKAREKALEKVGFTPRIAIFCTLEVREIL